MIERAGALADGVTLFDGLGHIRFGEQHRFLQWAPARKLGSDGRRERASGSVRVFTLEMIAAEAKHFRPVKEDVDGFLHVATLDDHGARTALDDLARCGFHRSMILDRDARK